MKNKRRVQLPYSTTVKIFFSFTYNESQEKISADSQNYENNFPRSISEDGRELMLSNLTSDDNGAYSVRTCLKNDLCGLVEFSLNSGFKDALTPVVEVLVLYEEV